MFCHALRPTQHLSSQAPGKPCFPPGVPQEAVALVAGVRDAQQAARKLVEEAYGRGSLDNISAVVLKFRF